MRYSLTLSHVVLWGGLCASAIFTMKSTLAHSAAPVVVKPNMARQQAQTVRIKPKPSGPKQVFILQPPQNKKLPQDPSQVTISANVEGRICYTFLGKYSPEMDTFRTGLVIINRQRVDTVVKQFLTSYAGVQNALDNFSPKLSPQEKYVLFKAGSTGSAYNPYFLYVLDVNTSKVFEAANSVNYSATSWAPTLNYIALVEKGDLGGYTDRLGEYIGTRSLYVQNWRTQKKQLVAVNDSVTEPFTWIGNTLLYSLFPNKEDDPKAEQNANVYQFDVATGQSRLLIADAYRAVASPSGKRLVFFGLENPKLFKGSSERWLNNLSLIVSSADGSNRTALDRADPMQQLLWRDERFLMTLAQEHKGINTTARLREWDTQKQTFRDLVVLRAQEYSDVPRPSVNPVFSLLRSSRDASKILVKRVEYTGLNKQGFLKNRTSILAVDIKTGNVNTPIVAEDVSGLDWVENK